MTMNTIHTMKRLLDYLKVIYYELRSRFVAKKVKYRLEGSCKKCGDCCRYMYSIDTYTEKEFEIMTKIFPKYKRFKITGRDEYNNLIFACTLLDKNGLCSDYKNRLNMCKKYPCIRQNAGGKLHKNCGYSLIPEKSFNNYLE